MPTVQDIAVVLLRANVISAEQLAAAQEYQKRAGGRLEKWLVQFGYVTPAQAAWAMAQAHGLPFIDLTGISVPESVIEQLPEDLARQHLIFPVNAWPGGLLIAVPNPEDQELLRRLRDSLSRDVQIIVADREQIVEAIERHYGQPMSPIIPEFAEPPSHDPAPVTQLNLVIDQARLDALAAADRAAANRARLETQIRLDQPSDDQVRSCTEEFDPGEGDSESFDLALDDSGEREAAAASAPATKNRLPAEPRRTQLAKAAAAAESLAPQAAPATRLKFKPLSGTAPRAALPQNDEPLVERHATVRYYSRMNPQRLFPLLVVLSRKQIEEAVKQHVAQKQSEKFQVELDSYVEVEPILAGCQVYPPRDQVKVIDGEARTRFYVVPHVLGEVLQARVLIRQEGKVLAEVPLEMKVVRQSAALLAGMLSFVLPFLLLLGQHFGLDFDTQARQGFSFYAQGANWVMDRVSPELLTGLLLSLTAGIWLWLRPRERDVFWDIVPHEPRQQVYPDRQETNGHARTLTSHPESELFQQAERNLRWQRHAMALHLFEKGLALGKGTADIYAEASQAAQSVGRVDRALELLEQAENRLGPAAIKGPMWYRMATLATRLGRGDQAMAYLRAAVEIGYADSERLQTDPELAPLRGRADFQWLTPAAQAPAG